MDKDWHLYLGGSYLGTLQPTEADDHWTYAQFAAGDAWGNFAPWFQNAVQAHLNGDDATWAEVYGQIQAMGIYIEAEDGEAFNDLTVHIDGHSAWFAVN